jgi:hypothetical protein
LPAISPPSWKGKGELDHAIADYNEADGRAATTGRNLKFTALL